MEIMMSRNGETLIIELEGEMDHHSASNIRSRVDAMLDSGEFRELVLNFSNVSFMDSSGLGVVLGRYKKITSLGGKMRIENVPKQIDRILRMAGVYTLVNRADGGRKYE